MRPFLPVISFVVVSFFLLAAWINYSGPDFALCPLLYLVRAAAWLIALGVSTLVFLRATIQRRLRRGGSMLLAVVAIMIFYPVDGFLTAHAEERVIQNKRANRDPHDDMGQITFTDLFHQAQEAVGEGRWMPLGWPGMASRMGYS